MPSRSSSPSSSALDLLGFSIASFVAQEIALIRPATVRRLVLASAALIPKARVKIYQERAHGFLFQHHAEFARDVDTFLRE